MSPKDTLKKKSAASVRILAEGDEFLTTPEASRLLKRSVKTLEYWRVVGKGPKYYRQGRIVRYLHSDLIEWATRECVA
jgi:hypothetical protein